MVQVGAHLLLRRLGSVKGGLSLGECRHSGGVCALAVLAQQHLQLRLPRSQLAGVVQQQLLLAPANGVGSSLHRLLRDRNGLLEPSHTLAASLHRARAVRHLHAERVTLANLSMGLHQQAVGIIVRVACSGVALVQLVQLFLDSLELGHGIRSNGIGIACGHGSCGASHGLGQLADAGNEILYLLGAAAP